MMTRTSELGHFVASSLWEAPSPRIIAGNVVGQQLIGKMSLETDERTV